MNAAGFVDQEWTRHSRLEVIERETHDLLTPSECSGAASAFQHILCFQRFRRFPEALTQRLLLLLRQGLDPFEESKNFGLSNRDRLPATSSAAGAARDCASRLLSVG